MDNCVRRSWRPLRLASLALVWLAACGNDGGVGGASDGGPSGADDEHDIDGGAEPSGDDSDTSACMPLKSLDPIASTSSGDIFDLASDGEALYFSAGPQVLRVNLDGGEPEVLYEAELRAALLLVAVHGDDLLVFDLTDLVKLPKGGGTSTTLTTLPNAPVFALGRMLLDGDTVYTSVSISGDRAPDFYAIDVGTGDARVVGTGPSAETGQIVQAGAYLYASDVSDQMLYRFAKAGGSPEVVDVAWDTMFQFEFQPFAADEDSLLLAARAGTETANGPALSAERSGMYRVPQAGGKPELLISSGLNPWTFATLDVSLEAVTVGRETIIRAPLGEKQTIYSLPFGAGDLTERLCVTGNVTRMIHVDGFLYLGFSDDESARIVRVPL